MLNIELPIDLHISGFLNTEKVDIEERKVDIQSKKWTLKIYFLIKEQIFAQNNYSYP